MYLWIFSGMSRVDTCALLAFVFTPLTALTLSHIPLPSISYFSLFGCLREQGLLPLLGSFILSGKSDSSWIHGWSDEIVVFVLNLLLASVTRTNEANYCVPSSLSSGSSHLIMWSGTTTWTTSLWPGSPLWIPTASTDTRTHTSLGTTLAAAITEKAPTTRRNTRTACVTVTSPMRKSEYG